MFNCSHSWYTSYLGRSDIVSAVTKLRTLLKPWAQRKESLKRLRCRHQSFHPCSDQLGPWTLDLQVQFSARLLLS